MKPFRDPAARDDVQGKAERPAEYENPGQGDRKERSKSIKKDLRLSIRDMTSSDDNEDRYFQFKCPPGGFSRMEIPRDRHLRID